MLKLFKGILQISSLLTGLWAGVTLASSSTEFIEGKQYNKLPLNVLETPLVDELKKEIKPGQVKVMEFFSYGCVWCFHLDPALEAWQKTKADYIQFERIPVVFHASWRDLTKSYYTAEALQIVEKVHPVLFKAIHAEHFDASKSGALKTFFITQGVDAKVFDDTFSSFTIDKKLKWAESIGQAFKVTRIPAIVILTSENAYLTTVSMAGSEENLVNIINQFAKDAHDKVAQGV